MDIARQGSQDFNDNAGDGDGGSSCTGYDPQRISSTFVGFNIQHGSKRGSLGQRVDAHQNCNIWIAVRRQRTSTVNVEPATKELNWLTDTDFDFVPNAVSKIFTMTLYNGISHNISSAQEVPYSLFDVTFTASHGKFRPRPVRGF